MFKTLSRNEKIYLVLVLIYIILISLFSFRPLSDNNESLYADIALSMVKTSNFLILHLDGVVYLEQPPLLYWLCALSFKLFGVSEFSARLPVLLSGVFLIVFSYLFTKKILDKYFALAVFLVLTSQI